MDLELLRTFLELNRTRHFGRAAEALFVTQAAVSSRLKSLESQLGVTLFERSRREMRLTPEGSRLIRHSESMIAAWRVARQDVSLAEASEQLVIGGSLRLWDVLLQRWLHDLRRANASLAMALAEQGAGVALAQSGLAQDAERDGRLRIARSTALPLLRPYCAITRDVPTAGGELSRLLDLLQD